jgi:hypothetical protein
MEAMIDGICKNCAGWREMPPQGAVTIGAPRRGVCQMFPPTPVPLYDAQGRVSQQMNIRPATAESESCLHFVVHPVISNAADDAAPLKQ